MGFLGNILLWEVGKGVVSAIADEVRDDQPVLDMEISGKDFTALLMLTGGQELKDLLKRKIEAAQYPQEKAELEEQERIRSRLHSLLRRRLREHQKDNRQCGELSCKDTKTAETSEFKEQTAEDTTNFFNRPFPQIVQTSLDCLLFVFLFGLFWIGHTYRDDSELADAIIAGILQKAGIAVLCGGAAIFACNVYAGLVKRRRKNKGALN